MYRRVYFVNNGGVTVSPNVQYHVVVASTAGTSITIAGTTLSYVPGHVYPQGVSGTRHSFDGSSWVAQSGSLLWAISDTLPETFSTVDLLDTIPLDTGTTTNVPVDGPTDGIVCQVL